MNAALIATLVALGWLASAAIGYRITRRWWLFDFDWTTRERRAFVPMCLLFGPFSITSAALCYWTDSSRPRRESRVLIARRRP